MDLTVKDTVISSNPYWENTVGKVMVPVAVMLGGEAVQFTELMTT